MWVTDRVVPLVVISVSVGKVLILAAGKAICLLEPYVLLKDLVETYSRFRSFTLQSVISARV